MQSKATTVQQYLDELPDDRKPVMNALRDAIKANIPAGFKEEMSYGMIGYVIPHSLYPPGYHCDPKLPLPFLNIASQKNFIAVYTMLGYADKDVRDWFLAEYPKHTKAKLDMGKSCLRFKKPEQVPVELIGELASKITPEEYVVIYESKIKDSRKKG